MSKQHKKKEYYQKSSDGLCRWDAICNAIGTNFINLQRFYKECDDFDKKYDLNSNFSREFFSIVGDDYDNIINHILSKTRKYKTVYLQDRSILTPEDLENCSAFLPFNNGHIWAVRRSIHNPNIWVQLDGKYPTFIHPGKTQSFRGVILIYPITFDNDLNIDDIQLSQTQIKKQRRAERQKRRNAK